MHHLCNGHVRNSMSGSTYMQQRYMDPGLGIFLSIDPTKKVERFDFLARPLQTISKSEPAF